MSLSLRNDFPMLNKTMHGNPLIYLDSAATAQKPQVVIEAVSQFYAEEYGTVHRAVYQLAAQSTSAYCLVREKLRKFLGAAHEEEIIFTRGCTESINLVAYSYGKAFVRPGDEIIISALEHHSNIVPWQILCEDRGAKLKIIPVDASGELLLEEYEKLLTDQTRLVAVGHVANSIGTVHPIKQIIEMAHQASAHVLVDGAQAIPHMPVDVQDLGADFYVFSPHKLFAPTGIGVLYGRKELLDQMPPYQGGGDMIQEVTLEKTTYNTLPLKFEAGTPMIAQAIGLGAAVDYVESIGRSAIQEHEHELVNYLVEVLEQTPRVQIIGKPKQRASVVSFNIEGVHSLDVGTMLDFKGVAVRTGHHCAQPTMRHFAVPATVRASLALYNDRDDVTAFGEKLAEVVEMF